MPQNLNLPSKSLTDFCQRHHIIKLSFFGSAMRDDFNDQSDVDVLVEFDPEHTPGLITLARIENELSHMLGGRAVDLRTPEDLSRYFRAEVMKNAKVQYAA